MGMRVGCARTYPMEPPGGAMATRRSNAHQLLVYISRTRARGTSAFLTAKCLAWGTHPARYGDSPARNDGNVPPLFAGLLNRMRE